MSYSRLIIMAILAILATACSGTAAFANETWSLVDLMSKGERTNSATVTVEVRNCGVVERKTYDCSAGTSNDLSVSLGGSIQIVNASVNSALGIGRSSGQSLIFDSPPNGSVYHYTVREEYQITTGDVKARSSSGAEQVANYTFRAGCSLKIESQETLTCSGNASPPQSAEPVTLPAETPLPSVRVTETPISPPTLIPDTRLDTILEVGQAWRQAGMELTLVQANLRAGDSTAHAEIGGYYTGGEYWPTGIEKGGVDVMFRLTSHKAQAVAIRYTLKNISATDNFGNKLVVFCWGDAGFPDSWYNGALECRTFDEMLSPGQTIDLLGLKAIQDTAEPWITAIADVADQSLQAIIINASGIAGIENARWRIPVPH